MHRSFLFSVTFIVFAIVQVAAAIGFSFYSQGFFSIVEGSLFRCSELLSSGSDDEVMMMLFVALLVSVFVRLLRIKQTVTVVELVLFIVLFLGGIAFVMIGSECGEIGATTLSRMDGYLLSFFLAGMGSIVSLVFAYRSDFSETTRQS